VIARTERLRRLAGRHLRAEAPQRSDNRLDRALVSVRNRLETPAVDERERVCERERVARVRDGSPPHVAFDRLEPSLGGKPLRSPESRLSCIAASEGDLTGRRPHPNSRRPVARVGEQRRRVLAVHCGARVATSEHAHTAFRRRSDKRLAARVRRASFAAREGDERVTQRFLPAL
jgi:hypothetical protein